MKFNKALKEEKIVVSGATPAGKRLLLRGIQVIVLDEGKPEDVHGIPSYCEAYGRGGWFENPSTKQRQLWTDGGPQGSRQGHPSGNANQTFVDGFYWGADYNNKVLYVRGRAGTDENFLEKQLINIVLAIFPKLPR